ncbi:subfamily B ATP-binding cassette protein MsbA [Luteibacter rhizovicinus]|uniref:Subfamily B ATP-binding cassette protein MsbA n=1 Tax=Luteibacter rhizovicinus TaxID=242606 RepID=A0A4R3YY43_9GAMM|nr:lipid A export permease/ATP-binding protein MsbA [Luteibacter rhizovicinus]TCV97570.1 subfamily B ATP-binding cassette protein MsbA [Luteibacter rhizovicinus]
MSTGKANSVWDAESWQSYKRLLGYTRRYWSIGTIAIIGMIIDPACLSLFTNLIRPLIDDLFTLKDPYTIFWMPIWIMAIFLVRGVSSYATDYGIAYIGRGVVQSIRKDVFASYLRLPATFFGREPSGQQISRITYTSEQVAQASTDALKVAVTEGLTVVGMLTVMLYQSAYLTLALLVLVPCVVLIVTVVSRRYRQISKRLQGNMGSVTSVVEEVVGANREVRIYGGQAREAGRFDDVADRARSLNLKISSTSALSSATIQTTGAFALALLVYLGTRPRALENITPGVFFAVLTAMGAMLPSLKRLTSVQSSLQRGLAACQDLFAIIDEPPERDVGTREVARVEGDIRFEGIHLVYPKNNHVALRGVDLHCRPGTVTALVGRSGSGKSSLVSLLPRFYEPTSGRILLDGANYEEYTLASLRRQIAWVGQNVVLFDDTVAANIAYGELAGASEEDIVAAARAANALEFIERMPEGLQTQIGQGGNSLSGGQRQRIAIARAILKNSPILVLDEATSALDTESERLIQDALQRLMRDRTTLVIAHRLSTIEHADQIAVMDQGRIVELGTHRGLIDQGGQYAALHRMQFHDQVVAD